MWVIFRRWRIRLLPAQINSNKFSFPIPWRPDMRCARLHLVPFTIAIVLITSGVFFIDPPMTTAAEDMKPEKKKKSDTSTKPGKPKSTTPKSETSAKAPAKDGAIRGSGAALVDKAQACYGDAPKIETISPDEGPAGAKVTINGKNFGAPGCLRSVSFGPGHAATFVHNGQDHITATVPAQGRKGMAILTVTTASGEDSKPFLMK